MKYIEVGSRDYRRALISMLLGSMVSFAIMYSPQPLISIYSEEYHISPSTASFSISLTTVALAVSMLFVSSLSNARGRKGIMSLSLLLTSVLAVLSSFGHNFYIFLALRFITGIAIAGFPSIAMAYLNEEFSPKGIGGVMGVYIAGTAIGGFFGRILIGALTDLFSWRLAIGILGFVSLLCSLWFWKYLPESRNFRRTTFSFARWAPSLKNGFANKNLVSVYILGFLLMGVFVTLLNYIGYPLTKPPYNLSQTVFGFIFFVNLTGTWSSVWFGKLADLYSRRKVMSWAIAILLCGALLTLNGHLWLKILGLTVFAFGFFAGHTVASGWAGVLAAQGQKAQVASFYLLFYYAGSSVVGWSGGYFLKHFGWGGVISFVCALLIIAGFVAFRTRHNQRYDQIVTNM